MFFWFFLFNILKTAEQFRSHPGVLQGLVIVALSKTAQKNKLLLPSLLCLRGLKSASPPCSGGTDNLTTRNALFAAEVQSFLLYLAQLCSLLVIPFGVVGSWCPFYLCHFLKPPSKRWFISCHHVACVRGELGAAGAGCRQGWGSTQANSKVLMTLRWGAGTN